MTSACRCSSTMRPFGSIRVGVSTVLLKSEITPGLQRSLIFSGIAILVALLMAAALSRLVLGTAGRNQPKPRQRD